MNKMSLCLSLILCVIIVGAKNEAVKRYTPDWTDLDSRPLPAWYDRAKIGIMVHWGVYSVPAYQDEWFWKGLKQGNQAVGNMMKLYRPGSTYQEFAPMFTAEYFNPQQWADLFKKAGAKYVVLTSKHHDGYTLFPSRYSFSWNSVDVGPHRDIVNELGTAVRSHGIEFGLYYSLMEWYNPAYLEDRTLRNQNNARSNKFVRSKVWPELNQISTDYFPSILWLDGEWKDSVDYWNLAPILAWLYNDSPMRQKIVVNDRLGIGTRCVHGDVYTCENKTRIQQKHKWENAFSLDKLSWGYRKNMQLIDTITMDEIIYHVVSTVSKGGNVLINVGPTKEGLIPLVFQERLLALGKWLENNNEAIYGTSPWLHQQDSLNTDVWYTCIKTEYNSLNPTHLPTYNDTVTAIFAIMLKYPPNDTLRLKDITSVVRTLNYRAELLDSPSNFLQWRFEHGDIVNIHLPQKHTLNSDNAWVLKFTQKE